MFAFFSPCSEAVASCAWQCYSAPGKGGRKYGERSEQKLRLIIRIRKLRRVGRQERLGKLRQRIEIRQRICGIIGIAV